MLERICTLFKEQGITISSILAAFSMIITTIVLAITGIFGGGGEGTESSPPKDKGVLDRLADALKRFVGKEVETLPAIIGRVVPP